MLPLLKLVEKGVINIEGVSKNPAGAYEAVEKAPCKLIVRRGSQIYGSAGLDASNDPEGVASVPPKDLDKFVREIRDRRLELTGKEAAVIVIDAETWFSFGSLDFAKGSSGIGLS